MSSSGGLRVEMLNSGHMETDILTIVERWYSVY